MQHVNCKNFRCIPQNGWQEDTVPLGRHRNAHENIFVSFIVLHLLCTNHTQSIGRYNHAIRSELHPVIPTPPVIVYKKGYNIPSYAYDSMRTRNRHSRNGMSLC